MVLDTSRPKWLTDKTIQRMRNHIMKVDNPYIKPNIPLDAPAVDLDQWRAYNAVQALTKYGISFETKQDKSKK